MVTGEGSEPTAPLPEKAVNAYELDNGYMVYSVYADTAAEALDWYGLDLSDLREVRQNGRVIWRAKGEG